MPVEPKEWRTHALNCMLLAKQATREESTQTFLHLSRSWTRLATELEDAQALLKSLSEIEIKQPPSLGDVVSCPSRSEEGDVGPEALAKTPIIAISPRYAVRRREGALTGSSRGRGSARRFARPSATLS
jgi:hypothetical protein